MADSRRFWILDFGFWSRQQSKVQSPKSKILLVLAVFVLGMAGSLLLSVVKQPRLLRIDPRGLYYNANDVLDPLDYVHGIGRQSGPDYTEADGPVTLTLRYAGNMGRYVEVRAGIIAKPPMSLTLTLN